MAESLDRIEKEILGHTVVFRSRDVVTEDFPQDEISHQANWRVGINGQKYGATIYLSEECHIGEKNSQNLLDALTINATDVITKLTEREDHD